jgi:hypothetical protein
MQKQFKAGKIVSLMKRAGAIGYQQVLKNEPKAYIKLVFSY